MENETWWIKPKPSLQAAQPLKVIINMSHYSHENHQDIRSAIQALCAEFPSEYHRKVDEERGYPDEFVDALTKAGWMAALIPEGKRSTALAAIQVHVTGKCTI